jgi:hypothetical protein
MHVRHCICGIAGQRSFAATPNLDQSRWSNAAANRLTAERIATAGQATRQTLVHDTASDGPQPLSAKCTRLEPAAAKKFGFGGNLNHFAMALEEERFQTGHLRVRQPEKVVH